MTKAAPTGKRCTQCLCCDAVIVFEGESLCAACDDGTHAPLPESTVAQLADPPEPECATLAPEPEPESRKVSMKRLTPDEIAAIQAAPLSETTAALARRLGLNGKAVSYQRLVFQRKQAKVTNAQRPAQQAEGTNCASAPKVHHHYQPLSAEAGNFIRVNADTIRSAISDQIAAVPAAAPAEPESDDWVPEPETSFPRSDAPAPSTALLCVDEDELDNWWTALDVEAKADAFVQWSLGNDGRNSHVYIEPGIPVVGTIGAAVQAVQQ